MLHLALKLKILKVKAHLRFLHLFGGCEKLLRCISSRRRRTNFTRRRFTHDRSQEAFHFVPEVFNRTGKFFLEVGNDLMVIIQGLQVRLQPSDNGKTFFLAWRFGGESPASVTVLSSSGKLGFRNALMPAHSFSVQPTLVFRLAIVLP